MKHILATALISLLFTAACGDGGTTESTPDPATPDVPSPVDVNGDLPAAPADVPEDTGPGPDLPPADCVIASDCPATNPCAYAKCIAGVCVDEPHTGTCDDGDGCTVDDACVEGLCLGVPRNCDDNNVCTIDVCSQGVCKHPPDDLPECQMILEVTSPSRGATLTGSSIVVVEGAVATPASPLDTLKVNGSSVSVSLDGTFSHALDATVGINIIEVDATDTAGQSVKRVQAFAWSPELLPPGSPQNVQAVDDASAFYLAPEALDDGDPSDMDDLAGVITELMATFNINDAIPHPLSAETGEPGALWCSWEVDIQNVTYEVESVDITPVLDGLLLYVEMSNVAADVSAVDDGFACPDAIGVVSTPKIMVQSEIEVKVTGGGQLSVIPESVTVIIEEPEVDIQAGAASFFNWLINWFEDDLADLLAVKVEEFVINEAAPLIDGILSSFAHYEMPFDLPSYVPEATGPATIQVAPTDSQITGAGAIFWSDMGIATTQGTPHNAPGQVLRAGCGAGGTESASFPKTSVIEASIHEDLFNQVLFQAWWAGVMETSLPGDAFESELEAYGITDLTLHLDPWLSPVGTTCTAHGGTEIQIGDVHVHAEFLMDGEPATLDTFASARVRMKYDVVTGPDGVNQVAIALEEVEQFVIDQSETEGVTGIFSDVVDTLLNEALLELFVENYLSLVAASVPIPVVDLTQWIAIEAGLPTHVGFHLQSLQPMGGRILFGGKVLVQSSPE